MESNSAIYSILFYLILQGYQILTNRMSKTKKNILEEFDMSCLPELGVSRQYDDLLTTRPFDSSSDSHLVTS